MAAGAGLLLGGAALWLLSQLRQGASGGSDTQGVDPRTQGSDPTARPAGDTTTRDVSLAVSLTQAGIGVAGGIIKGVVAAGSSGATAVSSGGGAAGSGGAVAIETAVVSTTGAGIGGFLVLAVVIAIIVATQVVNSVQIFQNSLLNFFREPTTVPARQWFRWFVGVVLTAGAPPSLGYVPAYGPYRLKLSSANIRKAVLTALYLDYVGRKATYDALEGFWARSTGQVPQQGTPVPIGGSVMPGEPWSVVVPPPGYSTETIKYVLAGPGSFQCAPDATPACDYAGIVAPASFAEAQSAALQLLGDHWLASTSLQEFNGKLQAIAFATSQLYKEFMPSPYDFVVAVRDTCVPGWEIREAAFWTTRKQMLQAYWLVDPVTGNRVAPAEIRQTMSMVVSMKGMEVSQGVFAGRRSFAGPSRGGFRVVSGRRLR